MNRVGMCVFYNEIMCCRKKLAQYTIASCENNDTLVPSHFTTSDFTISALDNFDHEDRSSLYGKSSNHGTVLTMFQQKPMKLKSNGTITAMNLKPISTYVNNQLPCQMISEYQHLKTKPDLPDNFKVDGGLLNMKDTTIAEKEIECIVSLIRNGPGVGRFRGPSWAGCRALVSDARIPLMHVGFLPYIPHPVTSAASVYTALNNLQIMGKQFPQSAMPVFCDEDVFQTVVEITTKSPDRFKSKVPMLGSFHMAKVVQRCIGKYLSGSGAEEALVECVIFGEKTVSSLVSGGHYVRSMRGLIMIADAIEAMNWDAFCGGKAQTDVEMAHDISLLEQSFQDKDNNTAKVLISKCVKTDQYRKGFDDFSKESAATSQMCEYWENFLRMVSNLKRLVAADREGDWLIHLQYVQNLIPLFKAMDSINYLRYASWYLERMSVLPTSNPDLYKKFCEGHFVVKENSGLFNGVAPDMKLAQTIQRSQKSTNGIIGHMRQVQYIAEWELIYHEVLAISNTFRKLTKAELVSRETVSHHELAGEVSNVLNKSVKKLYDVMCQKDNPYSLVSNANLHYFITAQLVPADDAAQILSVYTIGETEYSQFGKERFVQRKKNLTDTIHRTNLPTIEYAIQPRVKSPQTHIKISPKELSVAHRIMK